jgi:hypothetical protein
MQAISRPTQAYRQIVSVEGDPFTVIGNIIAILFVSNFWAHVKLSTKCASNNGGSTLSHR